MAWIYAARSQGLQKWGDGVGLTKQLFKLGVEDGDPSKLIAVWNDGGFAGERDWKLIKKQKDVEISEAEALERLSRKEQPVDPRYYPKLQEARGIFKVKLQNVTNQILVERALQGIFEKLDKVSPAEIGLYLIRAALPEPDPALPAEPATDAKD